MTEQLKCMEVWGGNQGVEQNFSLPGLDVWLIARPHENAVNGGDVYYLSSCASGRILRLLLADVSGHGTRVSDLALTLRDLMRQNINRINQSHLVERMNQEFSRVNQTGQFATAIVGTFFASTGSFQLSRAGHPQPLVFRQSARSWEILETTTDPAIISNLPLGVMHDVQYGQTTLKLQSGDMVLAYTDGLTEIRMSDGELLSTQGLLEIVQKLDATVPQSLLFSLLTMLQNQTDSVIADDLTVVLARANSRKTSLIDNLMAPFRLLRGSRDRTRIQELPTDSAK